MPPATQPVAEGGCLCKPMPGAQAGGEKCTGKNAEEEKWVQDGFLNAFQDSRTWRRLLADPDVVAAQFL